MQSKDWQSENVGSQLEQVGDASQIQYSADILVDAAYKKRVMEDLDALLADLQSTTAHISSYQTTLGQHHPSPPPSSSKEFQLPAPGSSSLPQNQNCSDHSSSGDRQGHVYQHQETHSTLSSPGSSGDKASLRTKGEGYASQGHTEAEISVSRGSYHSSGDNSGSSTPPPLPPPPPLDDLEIIEFDRDFEQPIYEQQTFHVRETTPSSTSDSSDQVVLQRGTTQLKDRGERMSALSSNLSELDQLLQDLNSAQFLAEVDRKSSTVNEVTVVNGVPPKQPPPVAPKPASKPVQRTSLDNLLDQLDEPGPQPGKFPVDPNYQELNTATTNHSQFHNGTPATVYRAMSSSSASSSSSYYQPQSASTATKELDELMMSLSQFKNKGDGAPDSNEPAYAKPVKTRSMSNSSPTSPHEASLPDQKQPQQHHHHQQPGKQEDQNENRLEVMLGDLQSNLNHQGVSVKQKGVCAACQKPIVGQVIAALGRTWHLEHFVCAHCEEPLGTRNFYERDSLAYCEKDYQQLFAPRCAYCNGAIIDKCITALEKMWHPEHFFCAQCGRPFGEEDFHEKNGKAYCREDYFQMFAPKCGGCAQPIMENYISALNRQWHPECFVCWECRVTFGSGSFFDYEGLPYCETHYHAKKGSLCASCERPITGRCITAMFRKFHPEHFVCAFCLKQLNKGTFKEQNDKPYCHPCFVKLFG